MAAKDLIPLGQPGNEEYDKSVRAKLKGTASEKRKKSAIMRGLKLMNPDRIEKRALQLATSPKTTALEIMRMIVVLKERGNLKPETEIQLIRALSDAYQKVFGTKNLNIEASKQIIEIKWISENEDRDKENSIELFTSQKSEDIPPKETKV